MDLDTALRQFAAVFPRARCSGQLHYRAHRPVQSEYDLGPVLTQYYGSLSFEDRPMLGGVFRMFVLGPEDLPNGLSGRRYVTDRAGRVSENPHWNPRWFVIALRDGDAVAVDGDTGVVDGWIVMRRSRMASDLGSFLACVAECITVEMDGFGGEVKDADFNVVEPFLDEVRRVCAKYLDPESQRGFMHFFFA